MNSIRRAGNSIALLTVVATLVTSVAAMMPCTTAASNLLVNGGFELGSDPGAGQAMVVPGGGGAITAWSIVGGGVRYCDGAYWEPLDGSRSLGLNTASGPGGVQQSFSSISGGHYSVLFFLAGDTGTSPTIRNLRVSAAGASGDFQFDTNTLWPWHMGWDVRTWDFTANSTTSVLEFQSLDAGTSGPAIDSVRVSLTDVLDANGGAVSNVALAAIGPNPGPGPSEIEYALPRAANIRLSVFDIQGREIALLANGSTAAGRHRASWDGRSAGRAAPAGLYLIRLRTPERTLVLRSMVAR